MADQQPPEPRILDIALLAGVGTATVDRVLNGRPGVRQATVKRVLAARDALAETGGRPKVLQPPLQGLRLRILLGGPPGFANDILIQHLRAAARNAAVLPLAEFVPRTNPVALADALDACLRDGYDGVLVQPVEHPLVRDAIARLIDSGIPVTAVLTNLPGVAGLNYLGLDNRAAGQTAGRMLGLMCGGVGEVALFCTETLYRSHEERESGLRQILRSAFPGLEPVEVLASHDNPQVCHDLTRDLLRRRPGLAGICNVAAGNRGIERALLDAGRARDVIFIAFNLTPLSRQALISGTMDAVIHQDMGRIAEGAIAALIAHHLHQQVNLPEIPTEVLLRENLRAL